MKQIQERLEPLPVMEVLFAELEHEKATEAGVSCAVRQKKVCFSWLMIVLLARWAILISLEGGSWRDMMFDIQVFLLWYFLI